MTLDSNTAAGGAELPERVMSPRYVDKIVDKSLDGHPAATHTGSIYGTKGITVISASDDIATFHQFLQDNKLQVSITYGIPAGQYSVCFTSNPEVVVCTAKTLDEAIRKLVVTYVHEYGAEL